MANNLIKAMKESIAKSGSSKKEIIYFSKDGSHRIRFLQELDEGYSFEFHNDYQAGIFEICADPEEHENCAGCKNGIGTVTQYVWNVYDYDSNSVKLFMFKASGVSPIPGLIEMYEEFGTVKDRDYKIKKVGSGTGGSYTITPLDKERFKNSKVKLFSHSEIVKILTEAYSAKDVDTEDDEDEADEEEEKKPAKKSVKKANKKSREEKLRDEYSELSFKELKKLAVEIGYSKSELKNFDDEEELISDLFDNYEIDDLEEVLEDSDEEEEK